MIGNGSDIYGLWHKRADIHGKYFFEKEKYQNVSFEVGSRYIRERINGGQSRVLASY